MHFYQGHRPAHPFFSFLGAELIPESGFSNLSVLKDLLKHRLLGLTPRISDSLGLGWRLGMCISDKFRVMLRLLPGDCVVRTAGIGKREVEIVMVSSSFWSL